MAKSLRSKMKRAARTNKRAMYSDSAEKRQAGVEERLAKSVAEQPLNCFERRALAKAEAEAKAAASTDTLASKTRSTTSSAAPMKIDSVGSIPVRRSIGKNRGTDKRRGKSQMRNNTVKKGRTIGVRAIGGRSKNQVKKNRRSGQA